MAQKTRRHDAPSDVISLACGHHEY